MEKNNRWDAILNRIQNIKNPIGAEIGVYRGINSMMLLQNHAGLKMFCIDQWSNKTYAGKDSESVSDIFRDIYQNQADFNYAKTIEVLAQYAKRSTIIQESSEKAVLHFQAEYFDFIFIDAAHDEESVKNDIELWLPKIKPGGWICGHDYGVFAGVKKAVDKKFLTIEELNSGINIYNRIETDVDYTWFVRIK